MIKKTKIINAILIVSMITLTFPKTLTTYADSTTLNYDSKYDLNNDSIINESDLAEISKYYNLKKDSPNWNEKFDFNNDGFIDIFDIIKISKLQGTSNNKPIKNLSGRALELQNLLASNKNVTTTKDEVGKTTYNVWVKGITPPAESNFTSLDLGHSYYTKAIPWKDGQGWYDINKLFDGSDDALCSGAVVSNMLHWWLDQNKDYVDRYLAQNPDNGKNSNKTLDVRTSSTFHNQQSSDIFNIIKDNFGAGPVLTNKTLLWYINGSNPTPSSRSQYIPKQGGFFRDVFKSPDLAASVPLTSYDTLNAKIVQWLKEDRVLGISYFTMNYSHIITIWGGCFDEDGNLIGIYTSNSDDVNSEISKGVPYGMRHIRVIKDSKGYARLNSYYGDAPDKGGKVRALHYLSLGKDQWEEYFKKN